MGFPHSDIAGYNGYLAPSQRLSQPYHVLHRFLKPRHPPYTLRSHRERCTPHACTTIYSVVQSTNLSEELKERLYGIISVQASTILSVGRRYILRPVCVSVWDEKTRARIYALVWVLKPDRRYLLRKTGRFCGTASQASIPERTLRRQPLSSCLLSMQLYDKHTTSPRSVMKSSKLDFMTLTRTVCQKTA